MPPTNESSGPTLEQLENMAAAMGFPVLTERLRPPYYKESLRNLHRLVQRSLEGEEVATAKLAELREVFGNDRT